MSLDQAETENITLDGDIASQNGQADTNMPSNEDGMEEGEIGEEESSEDGEDGKGDANDEAGDGDSDADGRISTGELEQKLKVVKHLLNGENFVKELGSSREKQHKFLADYDRYISIPPPAEQNNILHVMANRGRPYP